MSSQSPITENPETSTSRDEARENVELILANYDAAEAALERLRKIRHEALGEFLAAHGPALSGGRKISKGNGGYRVMKGPAT